MTGYIFTITEKRPGIHKEKIKTIYARDKEYVVGFLGEGSVGIEAFNSVKD